MKYIIVLLILLPYSLFSEYAVNKVEIENCHCDSYGSIYINELTKRIVITCDSGKFLILDSTLKDCSLHHIPDETEDIADAINLDNKYYIMARSLTKLLYNGRLYITDNLESYTKFNIDDQFPTNLFSFNNNVYGLSTNNQGSIIYKSNGSTFESLYQIPYIFWDIVSYKNTAVGIGITPSGSYAYKSDDLLNWEKVPLQNSYPRLRSVTIIGDVIYIRGENGEIIQLNANLEVTKEYNLGKDVRIYDLVKGENKSTLLVLARDKSINSSSLIELDLATSKATEIKRFDDGTFALEFIRLNGNYYFITNNAELFRIDTKTEVTSNQKISNFSDTKMIIKKENLLTLLKTNQNLKLYDIVGRKMDYSNLIKDNYLIQRTSNRILIINSF